MIYFSTYFFKLNNKSGRLLEGGRLLVLSPKIFLLSCLPFGKIMIREKRVQSFT